jgi:hypothetical protein
VCILCLDDVLMTFFVGMVTAKLNKEKLMKMMKMMSQQEEAPLTLGKRRKTGSSSKKVVDEVSLPPPPIQKTTTPDPIPASSVEVVEVPTEPSSSRSVGESADTSQGHLLGLEESQDCGDEGRYCGVRQGQYRHH